MVVPKTHEEFQALVLERHKFPTPRGRDVKKMVKPYSCREVIFMCSNGWTIELLPPEDHVIEGFFMGHCLGGPDSTERSKTLCSLREPDGTPHVTMFYDARENTPGTWSALYGRCNGWPKEKYVELINECMEKSGLEKFSLVGHGRWGQDTDDAYHESGEWSDEDYRDVPGGTTWRRQDWMKKRAIDAQIGVSAGRA